MLIRIPYLDDSLNSKGDIKTFLYAKEYKSKNLNITSMFTARPIKTIILKHFFISIF